MATVQFVTAKNGLEIVVNIRLYFASHIPQYQCRQHIHTDK